MAPKFKKAANVVTAVVAAAGTAVAVGKALKPHIDTIVTKVRRRKAAGNTGDRSVQNVTFRDDNKDDGDKA